MTYLAIDIGGTKTLLASFSLQGEILHTHKFFTPQNSQTFTKTLLNALKNFDQNPQNITIAVPGIVQKKCSVTPANLAWQNFSPAQVLKSHYPCPIFTKNDADLATFAESANLPGKTLYFTFSTGIGGGLAIDGILTPDSATFEPGHIKYLYQRQLSPWESFASTRAIKFAHQIEHISQVQLSKKVIQDIVARLTPGLVDHLSTHQPNHLVIGGPLALAFNQFAKPLLHSLQNLLPTIQILIHPAKPNPKNPHTIIIKPADHPTESVIRGCFRYSRQQHLKSSPINQDHVAQY